MKYLLLMYANEALHPNNTPEEFQEAAQTWNAFNKEVESSGILLSNHGLSPVADATTVRVREGKITTSDGPFAETHEQLAGYYLFECKNIDEAIKWAAKIPTAKYGSVEIRPVYVYS